VDRLDTRQLLNSTIRVIVVNADTEAAGELRAFLVSVDGVKIVAEVDELGLLEQTLDQFPCEVLLLHLDPNPKAMMKIAAPLIEARRDRFAVIAMTEDRDADLVVQAMRAGMREFLWKPFNPDQLTELLKRIGTEAQSRRDESGHDTGRIVSVIGTVGGVGATTLATNLAVELAQLDLQEHAPELASKLATESGLRVAVVDLDFRFGQVATLFDAQPTHTIAELCDSAEAIDTQMLQKAMVKHKTGVQILGRPHSLAQAEQITAAQCAGVLTVLQDHFDFVIVDGPNRFDAGAHAIYALADMRLLVMQLLVPSVRNADRILQELKQNGNDQHRTSLVCNRFGREAGYLEPSDVETILSRKIDHAIVDDWKTSATAVNMGAPLMMHAPKSKLRQGYQKIAAALVAGNDPAVVVGSDDSRKGLFSFLSVGQK
jgi:pilus assembly protein CpaE